MSSTTKRTMPIAKAQVMVAEMQADETVPAELVAELVDAVATALIEGWEVVEFELLPDNITIGPATGVMVGWFLPDWTAESLCVEGGEQDLHVTFAFLGDIEDMDLDQQRALVGVVSEVASKTPALYGTIGGTGVFENEDEDGNPQKVWWAGVDLVGATEFQLALVRALTDAGLPVSAKFPDWQPHITLAFLTEDQEVPAVDVAEQLITITNITVAIAGDRRTVDLAPIDSDAYEAWYESRWPRGADYPWGQNSAFVPFVKSVVDAPKRFTLGPWYIPDTVDAHDEWTDADELQQSLWDYVDSGYRTIHLQHSPDIEAGRWVEIMSLPWPMEVPVTDVSGAVVAHVYPAGTVLMGVIWEPWAWELVVSGAITGYSIGGNAFRSDEEPPDDDGADAGPDATDDELLGD